jgi:hypothetical protein
MPVVGGRCRESTHSSSLTIPLGKAPKRLHVDAHHDAIKVSPSVLLSLSLEYCLPSQCQSMRYLGRTSSAPLRFPELPDTHQFKEICAAGTQNPLQYHLAGIAHLSVQRSTFSSSGIRIAIPKKGKYILLSKPIIFECRIRSFTVIGTKEATHPLAQYSDSVSFINVLRLLYTEAQNCELSGRRQG